MVATLQATEMRPPDLDSTRPRMDKAAGALMEYLDTRISQIVAGDRGLRERRDPIHDTRVAIRRFRSTLRVFGKVLDASAMGDLDNELRWFAGILGDVRDSQVQQRRFSEALDTWPDELVLGPVRSRIRGDLSAVAGHARTEVTEAMDSARYLALMDALAGFRARPPVDPTAKAGTLRKRARRAAHKADVRLAEALESDDDAMLHRARKAAKRARYAAELIDELDGSRHAKRNIKHYKKIQRVLGDHQDATVAAATLLPMARSAGTTVGHNGFTYGLLYQREQQVAADARRRAKKLNRRS